MALGVDQVLTPVTLETELPQVGDPLGALRVEHIETALELEIDIRQVVRQTAAAMLGIRRRGGRIVELQPVGITLAKLQAQLAEQVEAIVKVGRFRGKRSTGAGAR